VPVVTSDLVLPLDDPEPIGTFQQEMHSLWRECVVVVDAELITQMGHFLRAAEASNEGCAERRQRACLKIFRRCFDTVNKLFTCQMAILADRVRARLFSAMPTE
jgi:hypothetical protein